MSVVEVDGMVAVVEPEGIVVAEAEKFVGSEQRLVVLDEIEKPGSVVAGFDQTDSTEVVVVAVVENLDQIVEAVVADVD